MTRRQNYKMGWIPDFPDLRDYTPVHAKVKLLTAKFKEKALPPTADLRKWCSPIEDQRDLGSCTAHAIEGVVEYFENKSFGKFINASRLFLYKTTRNLMHLSGDTGATLKSSLGALVLFGMPPEEYCPYDTEKFDDEPASFCYAFGQNYRCISYFRHDPADITTPQVLESVKKYLSEGIPSVFGFSVYSSINQADADGKIPYPGDNENLLGGHAIAAVGYDDDMEITNLQTGLKTTGALLIRNSWGEGWGEKGYGWMPYEYVLKGLAQDWWSVLKQEWVDTRLFTDDPE